jgi:translation elongation factor EF-Ts
MNELTKKYIGDVLPHIKPERRDRVEKRMLKNATKLGDIVRVEDTRSADGKKVLERTYYHANGHFGVLTAVQAGVASL